MLTIKRRLLLSHLLVSVIGAGALGLYLYRAAASYMLDNVAERLVEHARWFASTSNRDDLDALDRQGDAGAASRVEGNAARAIVNGPHLSRAFIIEVEGLVPRVIANASARSVDRKAPVQLNDAEMQLLRGGISRAVAADVREAASERSELSALAPIDGDARYVAVVRLDAASLQADLRELRLAALLAFLLAALTALVMARLVGQRLQRRIRLLAERCRALATGQPVAAGQTTIGDEFDRVIAEFDAMAQRLRESMAGREEALNAVTEANLTLESRVADRTAAIEAATHQLKGEIESRLQVEALLAEAALTDALTGLLNRRAMLEMLIQSVQSHRGGGFSVVLADIDHFKRINDEHGHTTGDQVLAAVGQEMEALQGEHGHAARWGGEEFFLLLPDMKLMEACRRAEQLRESVERMTTVRGIKVTVSIGVAEIQPGEPLEDCLKRCDQALYRAKDAGRNTVVAGRGAVFATIS